MSRVRSAEDDRYPHSPRVWTLKSNAREDHLETAAGPQGIDLFEANRHEGDSGGNPGETELFPSIKGGWQIFGGFAGVLAGRRWE